MKRQKQNFLPTHNDDEDENNFALETNDFSFNFLRERKAKNAGA